MQAVNLGRIPTPALASFAFSRNKGSIMVTGSHIPFDRNGYKTNSSRGELLKEQEAPINEQVRQVRQRLYEQPWGQSLFDQRGMLKAATRSFRQNMAKRAPRISSGSPVFLRAPRLNGKRILVYQHSAVGRDLLVEILERLGAQVVKGGRSDTFVPIDTENIDAAQLAVIQGLAERPSGGPLHAVVSTDGDSDRPLVLGVDPRPARCISSAATWWAWWWLSTCRRTRWWCPSAATTPSTGETRTPCGTEDAHRLTLRDRRHGGRAG